MKFTPTSTNNKFISCLLVAAALFCAVSANAAHKEPRVRRVYMFGFGASLTDSVACQTQVQAVDSAWLDAHSLLVDRSLYSIQLQFHLEQKEGVRNALCTVYFSKKERKARRLWAKLKRRYASDPLVKLRQLGDEFRFQAEQYHPALIGEPEETGSSDSSAAGSKDATKNKKGRKGKK